MLTSVLDGVSPQVSGVLSLQLAHLYYSVPQTLAFLVSLNPEYHLLNLESAGLCLLPSLFLIYGMHSLRW